MKPRILIVDDEPRMGSALATALRRSGNACEAVTSGADALAVFERQGADVVITDRRMPGIDGDELMRRLKQQAPELPVILITAYGDVRSAVAAMRDGAFDYVTKPFDNDEIRGLVARALELTRLRQENSRLRREVADRFVLAFTLIVAILQASPVAGQSPDTAETGSAAAIASWTTDPRHVSPWVSYVPEVGEHSIAGRCAGVRHRCAGRTHASVPHRRVFARARQCLCAGTYRDIGHH